MDGGNAGCVDRRYTGYVVNVMVSVCVDGV